MIDCPQCDGSGNACVTHADWDGLSFVTCDLCAGSGLIQELRVGVEWFGHTVVKMEPLLVDYSKAVPVEIVGQPSEPVTIEPDVIRHWLKQPPAPPPEDRPQS